MRKVVKGIGSGVGWIREAQHNYSQKSTSAGGETSAPPAADDEITLDEEDQWALDDAQSAITGLDEQLTDEGQASNPSPEEMSRKVPLIMESFISRHPPPPPEFWITTGDLPLPVILPQRRPGNKARGFIRAYAPSLDDAGIDQETFMDFLNCFDHAMKASPVFTAINIATMVPQFVPSITAKLVGKAAQVAVQAAQQARMHQKGNSFMDQMNEALFKPQGLYCLLFTYAPKQYTPITEVNLAEAIPTTIDHRNQHNYNQFSEAAGQVEREIDLPEAAPLVFPAIEALDDEQKASFFKKHLALGADYYDRRARAEYEAAHPESKLNLAPPAEFSSRYSDPNSKANSGSLMALLTGGHFDPLAMRQARREKMQEMTGRKGPVANLKERREERKGQRSEGQGGLLVKFKKTMKEVSSSSP